jgi:hypothetical protein
MCSYLDPALPVENDKLLVDGGAVLRCEGSHSVKTWSCDHMQMMGLCSYLDATLHVENHGLLFIGGQS